MKAKIIFSVLIFAALSPNKAKALVWQDPQTKINYEYTVGESEASVMDGYMGAGSPDVSGDVTILSEFFVDGCNYSVKSIGGMAFYHCEELTSVTIQPGITKIGTNAFDGCKNLTAINIPESVATIESWAFDGTKLDEDRPDGLIYLGKWLYKYKGTMPENTQIDIAKGTVGICYNAFNGCGNLTSVTVPDGVSFIGQAAFADCPKLSSITIPESALRIESYAFSGTAWYDNQPDGVVYAGKVACGYKGMLDGDLTFADGTLAIGAGPFSFYVMVNFNRIIIPKSVVAISELFFQQDINSFIVEKGNMVYDSRDNCNAIIETASNRLIKGCHTTKIPDTVKEIGDNAFRNVTGLTNIEIPKGVRKIGDFAFANCSGLTSIVIPEGVVTIVKRAFSGCRGLSSITLPESLVNIGYLAFGFCSSLPNITIPKSVTSFSINVFCGCNSLSKIAVEQGNPVYDSRNDCNAVIETSSNKLIAGCMNTVIPDDVVSIGEYAFHNLTDIKIPANVRSIASSSFSNCGSVTSITIDENNPVYDSRNDCNAIIETSSNKLMIGCMNTVVPSDVKVIDDYAFTYCYELSSINIPDGVTTIGSSSFESCSGLTSLAIPSSVTSMGTYSFWGCYGLSSVTSYIIEPFPIGDVTFYGIYESATLYVPYGTKSKYESTDGWSKFKTIVEMEPAENGDVNGDGVIDVADISKILSYMSGQTTGANEQQADINGDGKIDVADIASVLSLMAAAKQMMPQ